ncbi:MAG: multiple antibiotic resistance (MarC)-related protein [Bacteroidetes bacterium]|nr:multiple antibiotic resistance (MarC)-related protein [Bacteroidota bacterium]
METFLLAFIPLFVAIDVFGVLPMFVALTDGMEYQQRRKLTWEATLTAFVISLVFLIAGKLLFSFLGITESDFRVGGGIVLLVLAVYDLLFSKERKNDSENSVGVVPIGIPLIMGPAALTTIIILVDSYGYVWTIASLVANMLIVLVVFIRANAIAKVMGKAGSRAVAKVAALFLAGIAVMMIRSGITAMLEG